MNDISISHPVPKSLLTDLFIIKNRNSPSSPLASGFQVLVILIMKNIYMYLIIPRPVCSNSFHSHP